MIGEFYIDKQWQRCARACGLEPDIVGDPRFATPVDITPAEPGESTQTEVA